MIRAGNFTIEDRGFAVSTETVGGVPRQVIVGELPAGISDEAMAAFCAGPVEVLDGNGEVAQTHDGPFRVLSHSLKLTRTSTSDDVAVLTDRVETLEAELSQERSAKESALGELASLSTQFKTLQAEIPSASNLSGADSTENAGTTVQAENAESSL